MITRGSVRFGGDQMAEIKNWHRVNKNGFPITYRNKNNREIYISRAGNTYFVRLYDGHSRFFFSKKRALIHAMAYMRSHPNG